MSECLGKSGPWRFVCHEYWTIGKALYVVNLLSSCAIWACVPHPWHHDLSDTHFSIQGRCGQNRYTENPWKSAPCFRPFWHHACIGFWPRWPVEQFFDWQCFQQSFVFLACFEQVRLWGGDARKEHQRITPEHALENTLNGSYQILSQLQTGNFGLSPSLKLGPKYCDSCCLMIQYSCLDNYILCFSVITHIYLVYLPCVTPFFDETVGRHWSSNNHSGYNGGSTAVFSWGNVSLTRNRHVPLQCFFDYVLTKKIKKKHHFKRHANMAWEIHFNGYQKHCNKM